MKLSNKSKYPRPYRDVSSIHPANKVRYSPPKTFANPDIKFIFVVRNLQPETAVIKTKTSAV